MPKAILQKKRSERVGVASNARNTKNKAPAKTSVDKGNHKFVGCKRKMEEPAPPEEDLLVLNSMNPSKRFYCVNKWPDTVSANDAAVTVASYVSSNGTVVSAPDGRHILVDFGAIEERVHRGVFEKLSAETSFCAKSSNREWNHLNKNMRQENIYFRNNANIPASNTSKEQAACCFAEKFLNSLSKTTAGFVIFRCIIITSRDTDNWDMLKYLLFEDGRIDENRSVRDSIQVECLVFHGVPEFLPEQEDYRLLLRAIAQSFPNAELYLGSFGPNLTNVDLERENLETLINGDALSKMNFIGFSETNLPFYRSADNTACTLPYSNFLRIVNPLDVDDVYVQIVLPIINPHHYQLNGHWKVQSQRSCYNEDVLIVGVIVKNYSFLLPGDASINLQQQYIRLMRDIRRPVSWDTILAVHNASLHVFSLLMELFDACEPKVVCLPMFYEKGYPNEECIEIFKSIPSLWNSAQHEIIYFKKVNPPPPVNAPLLPGGLKPRKFFEFKSRTNKLLFTLRTPVTFRVTDTDCLIAQDWSHVAVPAPNPDPDD